MIIFLAIGIEILLSGLLANFINADILQYLFIFINFMLMIFYISKNTTDKKLFYILFAGFFLRLIVLFIDLNIGRVPFSGTDTEVFHRKGIEIAYELSNNLPMSWGPYDQFIGIIYYLMGNASRVFVQSINIFIFMISTITAVKILSKFKVRKKIIQLLIFTIMIAMPVSIINSSILLREIVIIFGITQSIYYILQWMDSGKISDIFMTVLCVLFAGTFHSAVEALLIVYISVFTLYSVRMQKFKVNFEKFILTGIVIGVILLLTNIIDTEYIFRKIGDYQWIANGAGSAYLDNLVIETGWQLLLYSPLKIFYFLFSPMPWMIRGISDILAFTFDVSIYVLLVLAAIQFFKKRHILAQPIKDRIMILYLSYTILSLPYAWGSVAAGTAIRHRQKGIFILLIATGLYLHFIKIKGEKNESQS